MRNGIFTTMSTYQKKDEVGDYEAGGNIKASNVMANMTMTKDDIITENINRARQNKTVLENRENYEQNLRTKMMSTDKIMSSM